MIERTFSLMEFFSKWKFVATKKNTTRHTTEKTSIYNNIGQIKEMAFILFTKGISDISTVNLLAICCVATPLIQEEMTEKVLPL